MPIKAKYNGSYKDITDLMNVDESIDYVLAKTSSSYKRVYTATRSIEDAPPTTFKSIKSGANLTDYRIYGQTVDGESVGDRTANLFDETIYNKNVQNFAIIYVPIYVGNIDYVTCSTTCPKTIYSGNDSDNSRYIFIFSGNVNTGAKNEKNGVSNGAPRTIQPSNGYVTIAYRKIEGYDVRPWEYQTMLNVGSTPLPYEPYGYKVPVTVEGKNLYKISTFRDGSTSAVVSAVTFTINNNAVSISGISSARHPSVTSQRFELISGETYSAKIFVDGSYDGEMYIIMRGGERQDGSDEVKYKRINVGSGDTFVAKTYNSIIYVAEGTNKEFNAIVRVILIKGSMLPDTYEPYHAPVTTPIYLPEQIRKVGDEAEYIDYKEQKQHRVRKNLLPNTATSQTINGVTFTVNDDGSVTCNTDENGATATGSLIISMTPDIPESTNLILSGCPEGGDISTYVLQYSNWADNARSDTGSGISFTKYDYETYPTARVAIRIYKGCVCNNLTFYPMIRKADIEDDTYEPYIENTDLDVTLPALPTLPGTNVLSVGAEVQPSKIDITGHIKTISGGS